MTRNDSGRPTAAPDAALPHVDSTEVPAIAKAMPWALSLMLHAGIILIVSLATIMAHPVLQPAGGQEPGNTPDWADLPSSPGTLMLTPPPRGREDGTAAFGGRASAEGKKEAIITVAEAGDLRVGGLQGNPLDNLHGPGGIKWGTKDGPGPSTTVIRSRFSGYHVVFVIDRSGSMADTFDRLRMELLRTISGMNNQQDFHVVFFASGNPVENPPQQLVPASIEYKQAASKFLATVQPIGQTDPVPALKRAFDVLGKADARKKGKVIFLLTDGAFPDNPKVLDLIRSRNADKSVSIFTCQYNDRSQDAAATLRRIASENRGKFRQVSLDD